MTTTTIWRCLAVLSIMGALLPSPLAAETMPFDIPTTDGITRLRGQIDLPNGPEVPGPAPRPTVVMTAGTGLFDRHVLMGVSATLGKRATLEDFLFDDLAAAFVKQGMAVVRYDFRGVHCNGDVRFANQFSTSIMHVGRCVDQKIRATVTPATNLADLAAVVDWARRHPAVDPSRLAAFGHSEGAVYVARLASAEPTLFRALIFMAPLLESPASVLKWQMTARIDDGLRAMASRPGEVTAADILARHADSRLQFVPLEQLLPASGDAWTTTQLDALKVVRDAMYQTIRDDALATPATAPYPATGLTQASHAWWQMFFADTTPVVDNLLATNASMYAVFGSRDSQTAHERQIAAVQASGLGDRFRIDVHPGLGHGLGTHALFGPIRKDVRDNLAATAAQMLGASR
jgi:predicted esterase